ncbi:hypothetical protein MJO29_014516 [Puccinia striiformis f. sp. tritici]|nr:hypothetical protein MJO29_014516 [Puccinia striiformis f. sp. tritici]
MITAYTPWDIEFAKKDTVPSCLTSTSQSMCDLAISKLGTLKPPQKINQTTTESDTLFPLIQLHPKI